MSKLSKKAAKAAASAPFNPADVVDIAKSNPYIARLIDDPSIRDNVQKAVESGRKAIDRLSSGKTTPKTLLEDKKLQADLRTAIEAIRDASTALTEAPKKARKARKRGRKLALVAIGGGAALAGSEGLRSKVLDTLFGAEEEFQYTPPAGPPSESPASPVSAV
jgi:hypothetical protein